MGPIHLPLAITPQHPLTLWLAQLLGEQHGVRRSEESLLRGTSLLPVFQSSLDAECDNKLSSLEQSSY